MLSDFPDTLNASVLLRITVSSLIYRSKFYRGFSKSYGKLESYERRPVPSSEMIWVTDMIVTVIICLYAFYDIFAETTTYKWH